MHSNVYVSVHAFMRFLCLLLANKLTSACGLMFFCKHYFNTEILLTTSSPNASFNHNPNPKVDLQNYQIDFSNYLANFLHHFLWNFVFLFLHC